MTTSSVDPPSEPPFDPPVDDEALIEKAYADIRQHGLLREGLKVAREVAKRAAGNPALKARALHVLGHAQSRLRHPGKAIATLLEAIEIYEELGDRRSLANVFDTIGTVYAARGRLQQALHHYSLSLVEKAVLDDRRGLALTIGNIGRLHLRAGRYRDAIRCFERDLEMSIELEDLRGQARMYEDLGRACLGLGDFEDAERAFAACLQLAEEHEFSELVFYARLDRAGLYLRQGRIEDAQQEYDEACAVGLGEVPYFAMILDAVRGELLLAQDDPEAVDVLRRALRRLAQADLADVEIPARIRLARAYMARGHKALAEETLLQGVRRARRAGYARYVPALNETMAELEVVEAALDEDRRPRRRRENGEGEPADGAYIILEKLGDGAFGEVYRAYDPRRGREVALKILHLQRIYGGKERERVRRSVRLELEAASRVRHPGVVRILATGTEEDGGIYVVQEYVPGRSLRAQMSEEPDPADSEVAGTAARLAHALQALDDAGVVHRDLKPENVIVRDDGTPVLVDFGIAHVAMPDAPTPEIAGTVEYMAPEQAAGKPVDGRADLYSLGVIGFEWLVGFRPLQLQDRPPETWRRVLERQIPPRVSEFVPEVDPRLDALIARLLAKRPEDRPASAEEVAAACEEIAAGRDGVAGENGATA